MLSKKIFSILISSLLLTTCDSDHSRKIGTEIKSFIPTYEDGELTYPYTLTREISDRLGLDSLQNGSPNIQLRFWFSCTIQDYYKLVILTEKANKWEAKIIEYAAIHHTRDSMEIIRGPFTDISSSGKVQKLVNELAALGVDTLPDMETVPGMEVLALHGKRFFVEIANPTAYRFVEYSNLDTYSKKNEWPASNMAKAFLLIMAEFFQGCTVNED